MHVERNIDARSCNRFCSGKEMTITYSESAFVVLGIQHEMRMAISSSVACLALNYFPTLSHKRYDFRKKSYLT